MLNTTLVDPVAQAHRYFDAWRRRDAGAVLSTFAPGGTYDDPKTGGPIGPDALGGYLNALWSAFPDLDFTLGAVHRVGDDRVHAEWRMHGHQQGPFQGLPPTGRAVDVPGFDVIHTGPDGLRSVRGYFDSAVLPRQLGLDVTVQPRAIGPFTFGVSTMVRREQPVVPGVLAFTELIATTDADVQTVREMSRATVIEHLGNPAFLNFTSAVTGRRMTTVSAWQSHEALSAAMRTGTHAKAMQRFFRDGIALGAYTSVYAPVRFGPWWRHCDACGAMTRLEAAHGSCTACGAAVAALA
jgi:steroid delta-isomerase-like uncharacterized protein